MAVLNEKQRQAFRIIAEGHNLIVIGQAGTGKSVLIRETYDRLTARGRRVSVVASTGMASTQFRSGRTLHSWAGLHDSHLSNHDTVRRLPEDNVKNIRSTDVLIVDECSMTSAKIFEQLEFICRNVREEGHILFGGLQVICVGDWFQLPPVANKSSNDPGQYAFSSPLWKKTFKHKVVLEEVFRQTDQELIRTINEVERGEPSEASISYVKRLERPLDLGANPIYLYGTNFEVDWHNATELQNLPGVIKLYRSDDSGDAQKLERSTAKKCLYLKVDCPVILLRNMGKGLVNGLRETIKGLDEDGPIVSFPHGAIKLQHVPFTVYNNQTGAIVAERHQYPVAPAFALTIHKAQSLTIPRLVVDCKNIFSPGQAGVAIGRAVSAEGLQVVNFSPVCCRRHPEEVYSFFEEPGIEGKEDLTCCRNLPYVEEGSEAVAVSFPDDEEDFDEADLQAIYDLELEHIKEVENLQPQNEPQEERIPTEATRVFTYDEALKVLLLLKPAHMLTKQQLELHAAIEMLQKSLDKVKTFLEQQYMTIENMWVPSDKESNVKVQTKFLHNFHLHLNSDSYKTASSELFSPFPINMPLLGRIMTHMKKLVEEEKLSKIIEEEENTHPAKADIPASGYAKVRYVGGFVVAKLKHQFTRLVRSALQSYMVLDTDNKAKVEILQGITVQHDHIKLTSQYQESLSEISRKQNLTFGLTNIDDQTFEFFLELERKRLPMYSEKQLKLHQANLLQHIHETIKLDSQLKSLFSSTFLKDPAVLSENPNESSDMRMTRIISDLYDCVVDKYLSVTDAEYRRKLMAERGRTKTMEHRKQVLLNKSSKASNMLTMTTIQQDNTSGRQSTHLKLKGIVMQDRKQLSSFNKDELVRIGSAYNKKISKLKKKDDLIDTVSELILAAENIQFPDKFGLQTSSNDGEEEASQECLPGSSQSTIQGTSEMVTAEAGSSMGGPECDNPETINMINVSVEQDNERDEPKTAGKGKGKGKRKGKSQGKGKGKGRRAAKKKKSVDFTDVDMDFCGVCDVMYHEEDEEPWIGCSNCDKWFHRSCAQLTDDDSWNKFSSEDVDWHCPLCT